MRTIKNQPQRGATLLEALAFLGIAAIVVVGAISMYRSASGGAQTNEMIRNLTGIRSGLKTVFATQAQYGSSTWSPSVATNALNGPMVQSGALPDTLKHNAAYVIHDSYNGTVYIDGDSSTFWVRFDGVPKDVCVRVASNTDSSWMGISINGNYTDLSVAGGALPPSTALAQCPDRGYVIWRGR